MTIAAWSFMITVWVIIFAGIFASLGKIMKNQK